MISGLLWSTWIVGSQQLYGEQHNISSSMFNLHATGFVHHPMVSKLVNKTRVLNSICVLWHSFRSWHGEHWRHLCGADLWPHYRCVCGHYGVCVVNTPFGRDRWGMPSYLPSSNPQTLPSRFPWPPAILLIILFCVRMYVRVRACVCVCVCVIADRLFPAFAFTGVCLSVLVCRNDVLSACETRGMMNCCSVQNIYNK